MLIALNEGTAGRRRVPARIFTSNGTSPDTGALDDAVLMGVNSLATISLSSTLRAVNANNGMYCVELSQSECSVLGIHPLYHTAGDFCQHFANVEIVNFNPYSTQSNLDLSTNTVLGVSGRVNSSVTIANAEYSAVTVRIGLVAYSGATLGIDNIKPANYSGVSVGVLDIKPAIYSGVSFEVKAGGIQASSLGAGAIDAAALATDAGQELADRFLLRTISSGADGNRDVRSALRGVRNRVVLSGLTGTVYEEDDSTSAWTFSLTTVPAVAIDSIDPGGV